MSDIVAKKIKRLLMDALNEAEKHGCDLCSTCPFGENGNDRCDVSCLWYIIAANTCEESLNDENSEA